MEDTKNKGKSAMKVAVSILLVTWILLLLLLAAIYILRINGYNNFAEWQNRKKVETTITPTSSPTPLPTSTPTPEATEVLQATVTPTPEATEVLQATVTPTPEATEVLQATVTPTPELSAVYTMKFSDNAGIDEKLRLQAEEIFGAEEEICYVSFTNGIYFSTVFQRGTEIYPVVYNLDTAEPVQGSDLIKDIYFAIVKERLQTYIKETFPEEAEDEFTSYSQIYQAEDYQKFYLTQNELVFYFDAGTLSANHPAFTYACDLEEAKAFFKYHLDGTVNGPFIRELDPKAKMIAITFDDGPYPKVENQILELFEKYNGRTTFFFLGHRIEDWYEDMPKIAYDAGHEVASHTYSHELNFATASVEEMWSEINRTNLAIAKSTGYAPDYVRFPGGSVGKQSLKIPMINVNWNMDSIDYRYKNQEDGAEVIFNRLVKSMGNADGGVVLLHSIYQNSYDGVEKFLEYLAERDYELVTLSELFYYKGVTPKHGVVYVDGKGRLSDKIK